MVLAVCRAFPHIRGPLFALSPKPTFFRRLRRAVTFWYMCRNVHENCVLADFLNLIPRDTQFGSPSKSKPTAFSGDEYCCDTSTTQINFIVTDVPQFSAVTNTDYNFVAQAVGVASHSDDRSFPVFYLFCIYLCIYSICRGFCPVFRRGKSEKGKLVGQGHAFEYAVCVQHLYDGFG